MPRRQPTQAEQTIDLDELLHGRPTWEQVVEFWKAGECDEATDSDRV